MPGDEKLGQNYPNPFNPVTTIAYRVLQSGMVSVKVFDILGREVATLVNEQKSQGTYKVNFDASKLSSGVYFYQLAAPGVNQIKKMIVTK
ncbi:MAG: T9SS type A sorting domain-containing protein [Bacteroidota bacterium]|nr:T9SS type A sorting domain-containing protein [Bacteroidota bacterium]